MNSNYLVPRFVITCFIIYLLASIVAHISGFNWPVFKRVNLITDVVKPDSTKLLLAASDSNAAAPPVVLEKVSTKNFDLFTKGRLITNFNSDTTQTSLFRFAEKLQQLKQGKKRKIRIGYFGDSMIEGDLLTQTLRDLLQKEFGGYGVGFVPITSTVSKLRQTVYTQYSDGWTDENFKTSTDKKRMFLSGHVFNGENDWVEMRDQSFADSIGSLEKYLLYGKTDDKITVTANGKPVILDNKKIFNRSLLSNTSSRSIKLSVDDLRLPVYGISLESADGIILDNFSFRGISGIEFSKTDSTFLSAIAAENPYDLLIFQYGVNVLYKPDDKNFNWYARLLIPIMKKMKNCFPDADILLVSTADRAFRYDGNYSSAVGIDSLIKIQATTAYQTNCSFYNQFATMGGKNSIVDWASRTPSLANKDYVHPNHRGAEVLATYFFQALIDDYNKYLHHQK